MVERTPAVQLRLELSADPLVLHRIVTLCGTRRYEILALDYEQSGDGGARLDLAVATSSRFREQVVPHLERLLGVLHVSSARSSRGELARV